jgi:hypothetical protein
VIHELSPGALLDAADRNSTGQVAEVSRAAGSDINAAVTTSAASGDKSQTKHKIMQECHVVRFI